MSSATFLAGAKGRLMPASIIFRFFIAAAVYHVLAWLFLAFGSTQLPFYTGGPGPVLGAIHMLTLGVLMMTVMGAALQLLSVITKEPITAHAVCRLMSWLYIPGVAVLVIGMTYSSILVMAAGGTAVTIALFIFMFLVGGNLRRASGIGVTAAYTWIALIALFLLTTLGASLISNYAYGWIQDHAGHAVAHFIIAVFGFMGLLAFGFSHVLVPMFTLSPPPPAFQSYAALIILGIAILAGAFGASLASTKIMVIGLVLGVSGIIIHVIGMAGVLRHRMRKRLGLSFIHIRAAWAMLPVALFIAALGLFGFWNERWPTLFGFLILAGWLLTFLLGMLQRIMPFLATMHSPKGRPLSLGELTQNKALEFHAVLHSLAILAVATGITLDHGIFLKIGVLSGAAGSLGFVWFALYVVWRMNKTGTGAAPDKEIKSAS